MFHQASVSKHRKHTVTTALFVTEKFSKKEQSSARVTATDTPVTPIPLSDLK